MQQLLSTVRATKRKRHKPRDKVFGDGWCISLSRRDKADLMARARKLRRRQPDGPKGKHYGPITAKFYDIFRVLLYRFHNATSGRCFPGLKTIADAADCAVSTVSRAMAAFEEAGLLSWQNRLVRIRERVDGLFGPLTAWRWRVVRTSNAYAFNVLASKSDFQSGAPIQVKPRKTTEPTNPVDKALAQLKRLKKPPPDPSSSLEQALLQLGCTIRASKTA
jgi:hypothetical protein